MKPDVTALVLAGGRSSRMGCDKTKLELSGRTMIERACAFGQGLGCPVLVASGYPGHFESLPDGVCAVPDDAPGCGPLGGLCAGLGAMETEFALVWAADMPFLSADAAARLRDAIGDADACAYVLGNKPEPMFALYRRSCLAPARERLSRGEFRLRGLLYEVSLVTLTPDDPALFVNLNTPAEFEQARRQVDCHE